MMPGDVDPLAVLQKAACFAQVEMPLMAELARQSQVVLYQKGEVVTRMGQHFNHLGVIAHGQIELSVTNRAGKRHVLNVMQSGQIYGLIPMMDGKPLYYGATAISQCTMVTLSRELMVSAMQRANDGRVRRHVRPLKGHFCGPSRPTLVVAPCPAGPLFGAAGLQVRPCRPRRQ